MEYSLEVKVAVVSAVPGRRSALHVRGTWSARDDRSMYAVCLGVLWAGMIAGFGLDMSTYLGQKPPAPMIVHVHAAVFTVWMLILTAQVTLVMRNRVSWHMKMGWFAAGWACLMSVVGPWTAIAWQAVHVRRFMQPPQFLIINFVDIAGFVALLAWGFSLRKNPAAHKRMMILATVSLAAPGFARILKHLLNWKPASPFGLFWFVYYGNVLLVALMLGWDWRNGRLMKQFVVGAAGLLTAECVTAILYFWAPWQATALGWVQAWAKRFG
jgi:hypothetical protein